MKSIFFTLIAVAAIFSGCGVFNNSSNNVSDSLTSGSWILKEVMDGGFSASDFKGKIPKLTFGKDGSFSGFDGCNSLVSNYKINGKSLQLGNIAATRKFCQDMKDTEFNQLLGRANAFSLKKGELTLMEGAKALMKFVKE